MAISSEQQLKIINGSRNTLETPHQISHVSMQFVVCGLCVVEQIFYKE
jgi:hypothetical protein